ncbi:MAG: aminotransferase class I/II-fold pyridoxal phosphate-dependent enzyme, partial [Pseudomonadota bacterium]
SKSHAMTGWRIGWAIGPEPLIDALYNVALCMLYGLPGFIQEAGLHALTEAKSDAKKMCDIYRKRRDLLVREIESMPGLQCLFPEAAMYLMVDIRGTGLDASEFTNRLYDNSGVSVLDATAFGPNAKGYVRISFTLSEDQLADACQRIRAFLTLIGQSDND